MDYACFRHYQHYVRLFLKKKKKPFPSSRLSKSMWGSPQLISLNDLLKITKINSNNWLALKKNTAGSTPYFGSSLQSQPVEAPKSESSTEFVLNFRSKLGPATCTRPLADSITAPHPYYTSTCIICQFLSHLNNFGDPSFATGHFRPVIEILCDKVAPGCNHKTPKTTRTFAAARELGDGIGSARLKPLLETKGKLRSYVSHTFK